MRWSAMNLTNEAQLLGLDPRQGDINPFHNFNANWGKALTLEPGKSDTVITIQQLPYNIPIAYQLRFALSPGGPFTPRVPSAIDGVNVKLIKSIDLRTGSADEEFTLIGGQAQPSCVIICRALSIVIASLVGEGGANVSIQAAACPVENIDCDELRGRDNGWSTATSSEIQTQNGSILALLPNPNRATFFVQNISTNSDVLVAFGTTADFGPPLHGAMILPAGIDGIYESPLKGYTGPVAIRFSNGSGDGGALITEGTY